MSARMRATCVNGTSSWQSTADRLSAYEVRQSKRCFLTTTIRLSIGSARLIGFRRINPEQANVPTVYLDVVAIDHRSDTDQLWLFISTQAEIIPQIDLLLENRTALPGAATSLLRGQPPTAWTCHVACSSRGSREADA